MFENHESVRQGTWDPNLDAYRVVDPKDGSTVLRVEEASAVLGSPSPRSRHSCSGSALRSSCTRCSSSGRMAWPEIAVPNSPRPWAIDTASTSTTCHRPGPADKCSPSTSHRTGTIRTTTNLLETTKACRLQPGETADDLSLQCPDTFGGFRGRSEKAASTPTNTAGTRLCWRKPFRECRVREVTIPATSTQLIPTNSTSPIRMTTTSQSRCSRERAGIYAAPLHKSAGLPSRRWLSGSSR